VTGVTTIFNRPGATSKPIYGWSPGSVLCTHTVISWGNVKTGKFSHIFVCIQGVPDFGRVFLMLKYTDITQNTCVQSWTVTEIMAREAWNFDSCYTLIDHQIHIKNWQEYVVSVMLISALNIKVTCEWHKAIKLNYKNTRTHVIVVLMVTKHFTCAVAARNALKPAVDKDGQCAAYEYYVTRTRYSTWNRKKTTLFPGLYLRNRSTLDIGVLGYIGIL